MNVICCGLLLISTPSHKFNSYNFFTYLSINKNGISNLIRVESAIKIFRVKMIEKFSILSYFVRNTFFYSYHNIDCTMNGMFFFRMAPCASPYDSSSFRTNYISIFYVA